MARICQSYIPYLPDSEEFKFVLECSRKAVSQLQALGHTVVLYTDEMGEKLFKDCNYNNIYVQGGNELLSKKEFFASVKFVAYEKEPLGTIFIDNDIIICKKDCIERVLNLKCDLVCQMSDIDYSGYNRFREYIVPVIKKSFKVDGLMSISNNGLNCGILKFNNEELKQKYLQQRKAILDLIMKDDIYERFKNDNQFNWELILEQWYLKNLCLVEKFKFATLSNTYGGHFNEKLGFYHFIGKNAKNIEFLKQVYDNIINAKVQDAQPV